MSGNELSYSEWKRIIKNYKKLQSIPEDRNTITAYPPNHFVPNPNPKPFITDPPPTPAPVVKPVEKPVVKPAPKFTPDEQRAFNALGQIAASMHPLVGRLEALRDSCLTLFSAHPLLKVPPIFVHPQKHFATPTTRAHYEYRTGYICFKDTFLNAGDYHAIANTMKHELLHAWIHQHDFKQGDIHGDVFKAAAKLLNIEYWG